MTTFNLIDKVSFQGKSFGESTADFLLSPARIALDGRTINVSKESVGIAHTTNNIVIKIICGLVATLLLPFTLAALAAKAFISSDRPPHYKKLVDENMGAIQMRTFRELPLDATVQGTSPTEFHTRQAPLFLDRSPSISSKPLFGSMPADKALVAARQIAEHEPNFPYSKRKIDFLIERIAKDDPHMHHLSADGTYVHPETIAGQLGYTRMEMCDSPEIAARWAMSILGKEKAANPTDRPSKIFLTLGAMAETWSGGINHAIVVVVEPDPTNQDKANITIVNPTGNDEHSQFEDAIIQGIKTIYPDPATRSVKNKKMQQFDPDGCGLHAVENIAVLRNVSNVQKFVEQGRLPDRTPIQVTRIYGEHARCARSDYERIRQLPGVEQSDSFTHRTFIAV